MRQPTISGGSPSIPDSFQGWPKTKATGHAGRSKCERFRIVAAYGSPPIGNIVRFHVLFTTSAMPV